MEIASIHQRHINRSVLERLGCVKPSEASAQYDHAMSTFHAPSLNLTSPAQDRCTRNRANLRYAEN